MLEMRNLENNLEIAGGPCGCAKAHHTQSMDGFIPNKQKKLFENVLRN